MILLRLDTVAEAPESVELLLVVVLFAGANSLFQSGIGAFSALD